MGHYLLDTFIGPLRLTWQRPDLLSEIALPGRYENNLTSSELPNSLEKAKYLLTQYFNEADDSLFNLDILDLSYATDFQRKVYNYVYAIPKGKVEAYGNIASAIGHKGAARAVGTCMASNPFPIIIPCHRVVASNGLGGYGGGLDMKIKLLEHERCNYSILV